MDDAAVEIIEQPKATDEPKPPTHQTNGKFAKGNRLGKGNPHAKKVGDHRAALMRAATPEDTMAIIAVLIDKAKLGEPWAVKEYLDRVLGKAKQSLALEGQQVLKTYLGIDLANV